MEKHYVVTFKVKNDLYHSGQIYGKKFDFESDLDLTRLISIAVSGKRGKGIPHDINIFEFNGQEYNHVLEIENSADDPLHVKRHV